MIKTLSGVLILLSMTTQLSALSLSEALQETLENQWEIKISEEEIEEQRGLLLEAKGAFDPVLNLSTTRQAATPFKNTFSLGLEKQFRYGTRIGAGLAYRNQSSGSEKTPLRLDQNSVIYVGLVQPLLKNFIVNPYEATEKALHFTLEASKWAHIHQIATQTYLTLQNYWEAVANNNAVEIFEHSKKELEDLLAKSKELISLNKLAPSELNQPLAQLSEETIKLLDAKQKKIDALHRLYYTMGSDVLRIKGPLTDYPPLSNHQEIAPEDTQKLLEKAVKKRGDILASALILKNREILESSARNQVLPELDFQVGINASSPSPGLGSSVLLQSTDILSSNPNWSTSLSLRIPLFNESAKGLYKIARSKVYAQQLSHESLVQSLLHELSANLQDHPYLLAQLQETEKSVANFTALYQSELEKLKLGLSTIFKVVTFQQQLIGVRLQKNFARAAYMQHLGTIRYLSGNLIEKRTEGEFIIHNPNRPPQP